MCTECSEMFNSSPTKRCLADGSATIAQTTSSSRESGACLLPALPACPAGLRATPGAQAPRGFNDALAGVLVSPGQPHQRRVRFCPASRPRCGVAARRAGLQDFRGANRKTLVSHRTRRVRCRSAKTRIRLERLDHVAELLSRTKATCWLRRHVQCVCIIGCGRDSLE